MGAVLGGIGSVLGGITGIAGLFGGSKKKAPAVQTPNAPTQPLIGLKYPLTSPSFSLAGGNLTRLPGATDPRRLLAFGSRFNDIASGFAGMRNELPGFGTSLRGIGGELGALQGQVAPGFGALTQARVSSIRNQMAESVGNLRESLGRRGVLGSSFASDAQARTELAFGQAEAEARAQSKMEEIAATVGILQERQKNYAMQIGLTELDADLLSRQMPTLIAQAEILQQSLLREMNELGLAGNIINGLQSLLSQQGIAQAQLNAQAAANQAASTGALAGSLGSTLGEIGTGFQTLWEEGSSWFSNQGGTPESLGSIEWPGTTSGGMFAHA